MTANHSTVSYGDISELHTLVSIRLERHGCRYTASRRRLVEALAASDQPITLPDIVAVAPDLAPSSVYRNLDVLERCGTVNRISTGGDHAHFELAEPFLSHHHHVVCVQCGTVEDVHIDDEVEELLDRSLSVVADQVSFTPTHHSLHIHGHCKNCEG